MRKTKLAAAGWICIVVVFLGNTHAAELADISNFRAYSKTLASSGQPDAEQLEAVRDAGFERVVYLAHSDSHGALEHEGQLAEALGLEFFNIPVDWEAPKKSDFYAFAAILEQAPDVPTLVHCQVNFRASSFSFLYRVLFGDVPIGEAKDALDSVWVPNSTWRAFIFEVLEENGIEPDCDACLWVEN